MKKTDKVVIIGCGFGGLALAKSLRNKPFEVLVLDRNNFNTFQPLLYQVATGGLEPDSVAYPVRKIIRGYRNVRFKMASVNQIDAHNKLLITDIGTIDYDQLVIASGSQHNFFNFEPVKEKMLPMKSLVDAMNLRSVLIQNLERAILTKDIAKIKELINVAIIGGGPTGVELAGALAEMKKYVLPKDFPEIDFSKMSITLFEASPKVLSSMSESASANCLKYLEKMGVEVRVNTKVEEVRDDKILLGKGEVFQTDTVIWTAGVKGNPVEGLAGGSIVAGNRIAVNAFNQVIGMQDIYAIGDVASHTDDKHPKGLPMLAPVAIQQGRHLAENLVRSLKNETMLPFVYKPKGVMATVGRNKAIADIGNATYKGRLAWIAWVLIHILQLGGFRNRLIALIDWITYYFNYDRPLGLIIRPFKRK